MKKYIAALNRDTITLNHGYKLIVIKNGATYNESEVTTLYPKYFVEVKETNEPKSTPEIKPKVEVQELLFDNSSDVEVSIIEEIEQEETSLPPLDEGNSEITEVTGKTPKKGKRK